MSLSSSSLCLFLSLGRRGALCSVGGRESWDNGGIVQVDKLSAFVLHGDGVVRWGVVEKKMGLKTTTFGGARTGENRLRQSPRSFTQPAAIFDAKPTFSPMLWPVHRRSARNIVFPAPLSAHSISTSRASRSEACPSLITSSFTTDIALSLTCEKAQSVSYLNQKMLLIEQTNASLYATQPLQAIRSYMNIKETQK